MSHSVLLDQLFYFIEDKPTSRADEDEQSSHSMIAFSHSTVAFKFIFTLEELVNIIKV